MPDNHCFVIGNVYTAKDLIASLEYVGKPFHTEGSCTRDLWRPKDTSLKHDYLFERERFGEESRLIMILERSAESIGTCQSPERRNEGKSAANDDYAP